MSLSNFKLFGWKKKPRTVLRSIKPGDVFCFEVSKGRYCFGRIIAKVSVGHTAEIYDLFLPEPTVSEQQISAAKRIIPPVVLDSYGLFDKKNIGRVANHRFRPRIYPWRRRQLLFRLWCRRKP